MLGVTLWGSTTNLIIDPGARVIYYDSGSAAIQWNNSTNPYLLGRWGVTTTATGGLDVVNYITMTNYLTSFKTNTSIVAGSGLTGGGSLTGNVTLAFDATYGDSRYLRSGTNSTVDFYALDSSKQAVNITSNSSFIDSTAWCTTSGFTHVSAGVNSNTLSLAPGVLGSVGTNDINAQYPGVYTIAWNSIVDSGSSTAILYYAGTSNEVIMSGTSSNVVVVPTAAGSSNLLLQVRKSSSTVYIDNLIMNRSTNGNVHVANDVEVGNMLSIGGTNLFFPMLRTSKPSQAGYLWNSNGFIRVE
jgi:hypothetical protein